MTLGARRDVVMLGAGAAGLVVALSASAVAAAPPADAAPAPHVHAVKAGDTLRALATHYGVSGVSGPDLVQVDLDPTQRAGLLTQGAFLAAHDKPTRTSIVRRGLKIRTSLLCDLVGAPPNNVVPELPALSDGVFRS